MSKRNATSDLNYDNWDREEDAEEAGTFQKAPEDIIKGRIIKVAKRRNPISTMQNDKEKTNAFGGFTAFSKATPAPTAAFGFLSALAGTSDESGKVNGSADKKTKSDEYYAKLRGLNESVSDWIKKHVTENPFVNLQPIFKDYDRYFTELEKIEKKVETATATVAAPQFSFGTHAPSVPATTAAVSTTPGGVPTTTTAAPTFSFGTGAPSAKFSFTAVPPATSATTPSTTSGSTTTSASFSFGNNSAPTATSRSAATMSFCGSAMTTSTSGSSGPSLSFGDNSKTTFSFGNPGSQPKFSFGATKVAAEDTKKQQTKEDDNEEDAPPKVEFTPVVEEGHVYTTRCKVFVKKDGNYGDRGVGNLYLKPVPDSEKVQLIVRADTNLGNLLCNFILSEGIPMQRMGKKDVMLVCLPTPETKPPPVAILLRVKTTEDADELLKNLQKYKK